MSIYPEKQILKDEGIIKGEYIGPRVATTEFFKKSKRKSFVTEKDPPNELRFNPPPTLHNYNTIHHITAKGLHAVDMGRLSQRDEHLILKAGEAGRDLTLLASPNYEPNKEVVMTHPSKQVLDFKKSNHRTRYRSIYRKEASPDYYDVGKIHSGFNRQSQVVQPKAMLDIGK